MLRAENKQRKWRGRGGREGGREDERQDGETASEWSANAGCSPSLGQRFMGDVHDMASSSRKPLSLPFSHMSPFISLPVSWSHRSCSGPGPLAAPAQKGSRSRLTRTNLTSLKGTLLLNKRKIGHCFALCSIFKLLLWSAAAWAGVLVCPRLKLSSCLTFTQASRGDSSILQHHPLTPSHMVFLGCNHSWSSSDRVCLMLVPVSGLPGWFIWLRGQWKSSLTPCPRQEIKEMETA